MIEGAKANKTQVYYLTVELTYPEFKTNSNKTPHSGRGGYYKTWLDESQKPRAEASREKPNKHVTRDDITTGNNEILEGRQNNDDEPIPEPDEDIDMEDIDPSLRPSNYNASQGWAGDTATSSKKVSIADDPTRHKGRSIGESEDEGSTSAADEPEKPIPLDNVQVLDLHSSRPLISYRGRVFEGQWAEVIGTEIIFMKHEENAKAPLPVLRNLPGDVDLLAASASRIMTTEKIVKPKAPEEDALASIRAEWNINIPTGRDYTGERGQQARFLENLIALKIKKNEKDKVTVYAKDGEGQDFLDNKDPAYRPRNKRILLDENGRPITGRKRRRAAKPNYHPGEPGASRGLEHAVNSGDTLSRPAPRTWGDLASEDDEDEDEDYEDDNGAPGATMIGDEEEDVDEQDLEDGESFAGGSDDEDLSSTDEDSDSDLSQDEGPEEDVDDEGGDMAVSRGPGDQSSPRDSAPR